MDIPQKKQASKTKTDMERWVIGYHGKKVYDRQKLDGS